MAGLGKETVDKILAMFPVGSRWYSAYSWRQGILYGPWVIGPVIRIAAASTSAFWSINLTGEPGSKPVQDIRSSIDLRDDYIRPLIIAERFFALRLVDRSQIDKVGKIAVFFRITDEDGMIPRLMYDMPDRNIDNERQIVL